MKYMYAIVLLKFCSDHQVKALTKGWRARFLKKVQIQFLIQRSKTSNHQEQLEVQNLKLFRQG